MGLLKGILGKIFTFIIGAALIQNGWGNCKITGGSSDKPLQINLEALENGTKPESNFIILNNHVKLYSNAIYSYKKKSNTITSTYYPIMSEKLSAEYFSVLLKDQTGEKKETDKKKPSFSVLVKTDKFKNVSELTDFINKHPIEKEKEIQGIIINELGDLSTAESNLIKQNFPDIDTEKLLVLEENGTPSSGITSFLKILGGILLIGFAILTLISSSSEKSAESPTAKSEK